MIIINNVKLSLDTDFDSLISIAAKQLKIKEKDIISANLYKKSVDARKKSDVHFCCSITVKTSLDEQKILKNCKNASLFIDKKYVWERADFTLKNRPVIVGFGPAGIFAALVLARAGLKPLVIERGEDVDSRTKSVEEFFSGKDLKVNSNVQFGEGGAGTFSDGKLNTGIKDPRTREILKVFYEFGANKDILTDAKPHIGTDVLKTVIKNIRQEIIFCGGEVRFNSKLEDISFENKRLKSITVNGEKIECDNLILCLGHSARDTFKMLYGKGISMERKPFAMGVRIEHLQSDINRSLYGEYAEHKALKAADYKMAVHLENGRGVYTFCMCPGGEVVNASSEKCSLAVNGMSNSKRDGENANSALLVGIDPSDIEGDFVLAGCELQQKIERKAYALGGGSVPVSTVGCFVYGKEARIGKVKPTVKPNYKLCDLESIYPQFITESLKEGIKRFGIIIEGFDSDEAVITAPETRSSSPVRITRNDNGYSLSLEGLYPCGEGAGYAGGIMSAAVDGMRQAEKLILNCRAGL